MDPWVVHFISSQIVNVFTVLAFYLTSNPVREALFQSGHPILLWTIFIYICAPIVLSYLITYWICSFIICIYETVYNVGVILKDGLQNVLRCFPCFKVKQNDIEPEPEIDNREREDDRGCEDVTSLISEPPSYHSLPFYSSGGRHYTSRGPRYSVNGTCGDGSSTYSYNIATIRGALGTITANETHGYQSQQLLQEESHTDTHITPSNLDSNQPGSQESANYWPEQAPPSYETAGNAPLYDTIGNSNAQSYNLNVEEDLPPYHDDDAPVVLPPSYHDVRTEPPRY